MRHASLFTGIGGFDLAAQWMGWKNIFQVEKDPFCQKVLEKNFPTVKRYGDIKEFNGTQYRGTVDILTGGFPCQPFSTAGKRKGTDDDRYLWPEMLRVIREVQPSYIVGENVGGLVNWNGGMVFDQVQTDLENEGFEAQAFILPACAVNAPHRRDRIWFVAYSPSVRRKWNISEWEGIQWNDQTRREIRSGSYEITTNTNSIQRRKRGVYTEGIETTERYTSTLNTWNDRGSWKDFPTQPPVCRRDDGVSNRMDRIKALGNAIVPQVAFEIFKAIEQVSNAKNIR